MPRTGSSLIAVVPALRPSCMPPGPWPGPLAVKLIAGHGAGDERRGPLPGRPDAVDDLGLHSGQTPNPSTSTRRPWIIQRAGPPQTVKPWDVTAEPADCGSVHRDLENVPARCARTLSGITLSDAGDQGERARTRPICTGTAP